MDNLTFYILDVFTEKKYAGNQLAVVRDAGALSDREMQTIALEMNYSETTFILSEDERDGGYDVRIFTPGAELPFAGHPTLGTAYVIRNELVKKPVDTVRLNLKVGQIPVTFDGDVLWMRQRPPVFGETFDSGAVAEVLNLRSEDIDNRFPVQSVSTGVPVIITPLKSLDAIRRALLKPGELAALTANHDAKEILIFAPEPYRPEDDLSVRFFAPGLGVPEDPATGSANGCLAGYLAKHRFFGRDSIDVRVGQGYEIKRPSLLLLRAKDKDGEIEVNVGGSVIMVAKGELV